MKNKWIELHLGGTAYSVNVNYIACVLPGDKIGSMIFAVGDAPGSACNADESYKEVMKMIREGDDA